MVGKLRPLAEALHQQLEGLAADEVRLDFSVGIVAEAGLVLMRSGAEGHCRLSLVWRRA